MGGRGSSGRGRLLPHSPAICVPQSYSTTPTWGLTVVNGYAATTGLAREMARRRVDLPALGKPTLREREPGHSPVWMASASSSLTSPTSAMVFISRSRTRLSPSSPSVCSSGRWQVADTNSAFPKPPARGPTNLTRWTTLPHPHPLSWTQVYNPPTLPPLCNCRLAPVVTQVSQNTPCLCIHDNRSYRNLSKSTHM